VYHPGQIVGYSRAGDFGADLFNGPVDSAFATWDMLTSIGPITGSGSLIQWDSEPVVTSGGILAFNTASTSATFEASVGALAIPEPETYALMMAGLGLLGFVARRKKRLART
jgi:hypothetical protein